MFEIESRIEDLESIFNDLSTDEEKLEFYNDCRTLLKELPSDDRRYTPRILEML